MTLLPLSRRSGGDRRYEKRAVPSDQTAELFRTLVLPHLADALALARWLTGSRDDAEDVVQDASIRALAALGSYEGRGARAWFLAIVRNTTFTWLAKNRPKALVLVGTMSDIDDATLANQAREAAPSPEAEMIRKADTATVRAAIEAIPHTFREVLVLRDVNDLSYKEIAAMLAIPIGTVMSRLARARALVATELQRIG